MNWTSLLNFDWLTFILSSIMSAGFSGAVWLLKTHSEKKITAKIEHEFNQKLEDHKAKLQKNIALYQGNLQTEFEVFKLTTSQAQDRRTRSNEKEYNACIECWSHLNSAFAMVRSLVSNFRLAPQLNGLNLENFNLYIEEFDLPEVDRNHIFCSEDRQKAFLDTMRYRDLNHTKKEIEQANNSLNESGIFFDEKLYITFSRLLSHLSKVWQEQYNVSVLQQNTRLVYTNNFIEVGDRDVKIIRNILRDNLHIKAVGFIDKPEIEAHSN